LATAGEKLMMKSVMYWTSLLLRLVWKDCYHVLIARRGQFGQNSWKTFGAR